MSAIKNFISNINRLIKEEDTSVLAIHKATGISRTLLYGYFEEGKELGLDRAEIIANALGYKLAEMIGLDPPKFTPPSMALEQLRLKAIKLLLTAEASTLDQVLFLLERGILPAGKGDKSSAR